MFPSPSPTTVFSSVIFRVIIRLIGREYYENGTIINWCLISVSYHGSIYVSHPIFTLADTFKSCAGTWWTQSQTFPLGVIYLMA